MRERSPGVWEVRVVVGFDPGRARTPCTASATAATYLVDQGRLVSIPPARLSRCRMPARPYPSVVVRGSKPPVDQIGGTARGLAP